MITNNHVRGRCREAGRLGLPDGRSFPATVVGTDAQTDLAVIQIRGNDLPVATLGDSDALQVGDWVVAIGVMLWRCPEDRRSRSVSVSIARSRATRILLASKDRSL
ncbi:MAG: trypsin-like peptidase domain-containing protein [Thermomicrobiales bacterium]